MRVLVFEPDHTGHHFAYLSHLLPGIARLGATVVLATTSVGAASGEFRINLARHADQFDLDAWMPDAGGIGLAGARRRADMLLESVQRARPDYAWVAYADGVGQVLGGRAMTGRLGPLRGVESEALYFRGAFAYPAEHWKARLRAEWSWWGAARAPFTTLHHLDPLVLEAIARRNPRAAPRWTQLPDPVETGQPLDRATALEALAVRSRSRTIGLAGGIDARKGAPELIRAFAAADLHDDQLLLVGPHDEMTRSLLRGDFAPLVRSGRIVSLDRLFAPDELAASFYAMDVVCTPYPRHIGSASIVIRAAAAGRPVLGSDFGWVGEMIRRFELGATCPVGNVDVFARSIREALDAAPSHRPGERATRFIRYHSPENFVACATAQVAQRMSIGPLRALEWRWVEEGDDARAPGTLTAR